MSKEVFHSKDYFIQRDDDTSVNLSEITRFVVAENFQHHSVNYTKEYLAAEVSELYSDESLYSNHSTYYVARDAANQMIGAIRIMKWDKKCELPIQKIWGINPLSETGTMNIQGNIWHVGRFAISSSKNVAGLSLFKQLLVYALAPL